jgi:hypothetical protein
MNKKLKGTRGEAGAKALKKSGEQKVKENTKKLMKALQKFKEQQIPLVKTVLAEESGLSIATLNRKPYKDIISEHLDEEKVLLSPKGKQEIAMLINENKKLKKEIEEWKDRYNRLKKEINYSKELFS